MACGTPEAASTLLGTNPTHHPVLSADDYSRRCDWSRTQYPLMVCPGQQITLSTESKADRGSGSGRWEMTRQIGRDLLGPRSRSVPVLPMTQVMMPQRAERANAGGAGGRWRMLFARLERAWSRFDRAPSGADRLDAGPRALGLVLLGLFLLTSVWLLLPHSKSFDGRAIFVANSAIAACGVALTVGRPGWLARDRGLWLVVASTSLLISTEVYFTHRPSSGLSFLYLWATPYAYSFWSGRQAIVQTAIMGLGLAAAYWLQVLAEPGLGSQADLLVGRWLVAIATSLAVGLLVRRLTRFARSGETRFRRSFSDSSVAMALVSQDGGFMDVNDALCRLLGYERAALLTMSPFDVSPPEDAAQTRARLEQLAVTGVPQRFEKRCLRSSGESVWSSVDATLIQDSATTYFLLQAQDVTERKLAHERLHRLARQQSAVAALGRDGLASSDLDGLFERAVAALCAVLGAPMSAILRDTNDARVSLEASCGWEVDKALHRAIPAGPHTKAGHVLRHGDPVVIADTEQDHRLDISESSRHEGVRGAVAVAIPGRDGQWGVLSVYSREPREFAVDEVDFISAVGHVLSAAIERHDREEASRHHALHDPLTGLPNRTLLLDRLTHAIRRTRDPDSNVAVLLLDLDRFKIVNDSLGHEAGDRLLIALAPRLRDALGPSDTIARLGGDEFAVVCEDVRGPRAAIEITERLQAAVRNPLVVDAHQHFLHASIGVVLAERTHVRPDELLRDADAAMYLAKERGRGRFELFDEQLRHRVVGRLQTESELRVAIERHEIEPYYQPLVNLETRQIIGVEALARWRHPTQGVIGPNDFIDIAEETGLIGELGQQMLQRACHDVATWQARYPEHRRMQVCVNVSGKQLADQSFPARVAELIRSCELTPGTLGLEITETILLEEAQAPTSVLAGLREHGIRLLLDDFGTGYSSMSYLNRFSLDTLKIDRSFVAGILDRPCDTAIVNATIQMAKAIGMVTVAEGVEHAEQAECLQELGCQYAQGYLFAKPMPAKEIEQLLRTVHAQPVPALQHRPA